MFHVQTNLYRGGIDAYIVGEGGNKLLFSCDSNSTPVHRYDKQLTQNLNFTALFKLHTIYLYWRLIYAI